MSGQRADARKRQSEHDARMLAEAERLAVQGKVLAALRRVYPTSDWLDGSALKDALEDEGLLR